MKDGARAIEVLHCAAESEDPLLHGSLVFPNYGQLVMTGDLRGHRRTSTSCSAFATWSGLRHGT
jgi:hypothetical protein